MIEFSFNSLPHRALGRSPYAFMFGRDPRVPTQNVFPTPPVDTKGWKPNMKTYWREMQQKLDTMHQIREEHITKYHESFNKLQTPKPPFKPGDWVLKRLPRESRQKLSLHWDGPYIVTKHLTPPNLEEGKGNVFIISDHEGNTMARSAVDLKLYNFPKDDDFVLPEAAPPSDEERR